MSRKRLIILNMLRCSIKKIKEAKLIYDHDQITMNINNNKNLWKIINSKLGKKIKNILI